MSNPWWFSEILSPCGRCLSFNTLVPAGYAYNDLSRFYYVLFIWVVIIRCILRCELLSLYIFSFTSVMLISSHHRLLVAFHSFMGWYAHICTHFQGQFYHNILCSHAWSDIYAPMYFGWYVLWLHVLWLICQYVSHSCAEMLIGTHIHGLIRSYVFLGLICPYVLPWAIFS